MPEERTEPSSEDLIRQARDSYTSTPDETDAGRLGRSDQPAGSEPLDDPPDQPTDADRTPPIAQAGGAGPGEPRKSQSDGPDPSNFPPFSAASSGLPANPGEQTTKARRLPWGWIIFGLFALGGFIYDYFTDAKRDESGAVVTAGEVSADGFEIGDCLLLPEGVAFDDEFSFDSLEAVPCADPHDLEFFGVVNHPGDEHPGDDALFGYADEQCSPGFEEFTGVAPEHDARLVLMSFIPDPEGWSNGDREIGCVLQNYDGTMLVGSQRGNGLLGFSGLEVSYCYDVTETSTYVAFDKVACDGPHDIEYFGSSALSHGESEQFPGNEWLWQYGSDECGGQFEAYVGRPWEPDVPPDYSWVLPTEETWSFGDRLVQCFLVDPAGGRLDRSYSEEA